MINEILIELHENLLVTYKNTDLLYNKVLFNTFALQTIFYCSTEDAANVFSNLRFCSFGKTIARKTNILLVQSISAYSGTVAANTLDLVIDLDLAMKSCVPEYLVANNWETCLMYLRCYKNSLNLLKYFFPTATKLNSKTTPTKISTLKI